MAASLKMMEDVIEKKMMEIKKIRKDEEQRSAI